MLVTPVNTNFRIMRTNFVGALVFVLTRVYYTNKILLLVYVQFIGTTDTKIENGSKFIEYIN